MGLYFGFGLKIKSSLPFPELTSITEDSEELCDIEITFGKIDKHPDPVKDSDRGFWVHGNQACYSWQEVGVFLVSNGQKILIDPYKDVQERVLRLCILGPVMALALLQRGYLTLHASCVEINGEAVAFLGGSGWGKSTMAATLQTLGHPVITDDLTAFEPGGSNRIVPSFPQLKLWPDAVDALGHSSDELPILHPKVDKRALRFEQNFALEPIPLRRLYILSVGQTTTIDSLKPMQSFEILNWSWYCARFGNKLIDAMDLRSHFLRISTLARTTPVKRLQRPTTLKDDPELGKTIEHAILQDLHSS